MTEISVVVPVHNAEGYLPEALDCIRAQSFADFELICVDDGSSDGSAAILAAAASADNRIRVITQDNQGPGPARNAGLAAARGSYVIFLDADDLFERTMLEHAHARAVQTQADIVVFGAQALLPGGETDSRKAYLDMTRVPAGSPTFNLESNSGYITRFTHAAPWNKLFSRRFLAGQGLVFRPLGYAEDLPFVYAALCLADSIAVLDECLVTYRVNVSGSLQTGKGAKAAQVFDAYECLVNDLASRGVLEKARRSVTDAMISSAVFELRGATGEDYWKIARALDAHADSLGIFRDEEQSKLRSCVAELHEALDALHRHDEDQKHKSILGAAIGKAFRKLTR